MTDEMIVTLYWDRDERAIDETDKKYRKYLTRIAQNVLSDEEDAKESVNDTFLAAWDSIPPNRPKNLSTYLGKLTRRISIDIFRKKNRDKRKGSQYALSLSELSCIASGEPSPHEKMENELLSKKISEFLRTQDARTRNVFIGRYYNLDSVKEIARYCDMKEATVKTVLHRTRLDLKAYLEKEGYEI